MASPNLPETITGGVTAGHPSDSQKANTILNRLDVDDLPTTKGDLYVFDGTTMRRLGAGTDGFVLTAASAETLGLTWAEASGGGGYLLDPNLKPPDTPHGSDLEFQAMANGTTVATMGMTWLNQGSRTASVKGGRLILFVPASEAGYGGLGIGPPASGNFSFTIRHRSWPIQNYHGVGLLAVDDSPAGTFGTYRYVTRWLADNNVYFTHVTNAWNFSTNPASTNHSFNRAEYSYERFVWTGEATGTIGWEITADPLAGWFRRHTSGTVARPTFIGCNMTGESSSTWDLYASMDFWRFDWTPDFDPTA